MSDQYLIPAYARQPVSFERGEGVWLYDTAGKRYMDALSGIGVCGLGHAHPVVTRAIHEQAARLVHTSNMYRIPSQEQLATRLCAISGMDKVFFGNSGAEANEAAIKLARLHGHRRGIKNPVILVMDGSFHGRTMGTLSATANPKAREGFAPLLDGFRWVAYNDVPAARAAASDDVVAILAEPVQGEGGLRVADEGFLAGLRELCDEQGWLLMLDEVQCGNGRTGTYFACQAAGVRPDVLTTAKGLGNGFPIGACLVSGAASDLFGPGSHGSTYGGSPLATAAALATVQALTDGVIDAVADKGRWLQATLSERLADVPLVREVRGRGLMIGIELGCPCGEVMNRAREAGLLCNVTAGSVIRLLPPLIINSAELEALVDMLVTVIREFARTQEPA